MAMRYPMPSVLSPVIDLKTGKLTTAWVNYLKGLEEVAGRFSGGAEGQIAFPSTQSPSTDANTLDDYEEGTWTPVLTFVTPGDLSVVYSTQVGSYTKIGRLVVLNCLVVTSTFTHSTAVGAVNLTGVPFAGAGANAYSAAAWQGITKANYTAIVARVQAGTSVVDFIGSGSAQALSLIGAGDMPSGGTVILSASISYNV